MIGINKNILLSSIKKLNLKSFTTAQCLCVYGLFYTCKTQLHINIDVIQLVTIVAYGEESSLTEKTLGGYYNE